jgi:hypothetical protein
VGLWRNGLTFEGRHHSGIQGTFVIVATNRRSVESRTTATALFVFESIAGLRNWLHHVGNLGVRDPDVGQIFGVPGWSFGGLVSPPTGTILTGSWSIIIIMYVEI